jgi:WD40 repeat protein
MHPVGSPPHTLPPCLVAQVWDVTGRACSQTLTQHTDSVWGIVFRPDGTRLASCSDDKSICIYDVV